MDGYSKKQLLLISEIEEKFKNGEVPSTIVTPVKDYKNDNRICLTAVAFIPPELEQQIIENIIKPLKEADNRQYFYVPNSFHVTIQNIRIIEDPPLFDSSDIEKAKEVFEKIVPKHPRISFRLKRLFELPTSLSVCAFSNESLGILANELRAELANSGVPDNKKYASNDVVLGSTTIIRFTTEPNAEFKNIVSQLKNIEIGNFEVSKINLITTNCVCVPDKTTVFGEYNLI